MSRREELEMRKRHGDILTNIISEQRQMAAKITAKTATRRDELVMRKKHGDLMQQIINEQRDFKQRQATGTVAKPGPIPIIAPMAPPTPVQAQVPVKNFDKDINQLQEELSKTKDEGPLNDLLKRANELLRQVTDEYKRLTLQLKDDLAKPGAIVPSSQEEKEIIRKIIADDDTPQVVKDALKTKGLTGGGLARSFFDEVIGY